LFGLPALDPFEDLFPVDGNVARSFNADSYLVTLDPHHCEDDIIVDDDLLARLSRQD
jgi:hypothetical protein